MILKVKLNLRYYLLALYWGQTIYPIIVKVNADLTPEFSRLSRADRLLNWNARRKHRLIKHRWHKWVNPTPKDDAPEISRVECKHCHIYAYVATKEQH